MWTCVLCISALYFVIIFIRHCVTVSHLNISVQFHKLQKIVSEMCVNWGMCLEKLKKKRDWQVYPIRWLANGLSLWSDKIWFCHHQRKIMVHFNSYKICCIVYPYNARLFAMLFQASRSSYGRHTVLVIAVFRKLYNIVNFGSPKLIYQYIDMEFWIRHQHSLWSWI